MYAMKHIVLAVEHGYQEEFNMTPLQEETKESIKKLDKNLRDVFDMTEKSSNSQEETMEERIRKQWDAKLLDVLDEQFPKDNEGVEYIRPSRSRRSEAMVLYAKAFIVAEEILHKELSIQHQADCRKFEKNIAWCECGDALEAKPIMRKLDKKNAITLNGKQITEVVDHYEYYCFGCDKTYTLIALEKMKEKV